MAIRVAVVDPLPMFRQGVAATLSAAGHRVELPDDVVAWVRQGHDRVVLLTLDSINDWTLLTRLDAGGAAGSVIAVVEDDVAALTAVVLDASFAFLGPGAPTPIELENDAPLGVGCGERC